MGKSRLEAFSDGVIAITIMVLEMKAPRGETLAARAPWLAQAVYVGVALLWLVPDRRIERLLRDRE